MIPICFFLDLTGWDSPTRWLFLLLMYSLLGALLLYAVIIVAREKLRERVENGSMGRGITFALRRMGLMLTGEQAIRRGSRAGMLLLTFAAGYGIRDYQLTQNTFTYEGVTVNSQVSDKRYWVTIPGYTRQRDFEFCHALKMPATVIDIRYEQKYGCKQVYGVGFVQPHKEKNDELQNGRNTATATETARAGLERTQEAQAR